MRYNPEQPTKVSKYNKDIIEFINKNIDQINSTGIEIVLSLIDEDDNETLKLLQKKGVSKLPALLGKGIKEPIQKTDKIKKFLLSNFKTKKAIPVKNGDEELRDYQWDVMEMGDDKNEDEAGGRNSAEIQARVEYETKRRERQRGQSNDKPMTADEIVAQQRRGRNQRVKSRKPVQRPRDDDDDDEEEVPRQRRGKREKDRRGNMDPDPVDILNDMPARNQDEAIDNDLASKFWSGRGVGGGD